MGNNNKIIYTILTIVIISWVLYWINSPKTLNVSKEWTNVEYSKGQQEQEVKNFNIVLNSIQKKEDISKCNELSDLKWLCIAQINDRFSIERTFMKTSQCNGLPKKLGESVEQTKDVCMLNVAFRTARQKKDMDLCNPIKNSDLKNLCKAQIKARF